MVTISKRMRAVYEKVLPDKLYSLPEGLNLLKELSSVNFRETVEFAAMLGIDTRKSEQMVRFSVVLPKGTGHPPKKVLVFTSPAYSDVALKAGADWAGLEELIPLVKAEKLNYEAVLATPDVIRGVAQLGQLLGPKGLMPNLKDGTLTYEIADAIQAVKKGQVRLRADKAGGIHCPMGKIDFGIDDLIENFTIILQALRKAKPSTAKGIYLKKIVLSTTMGPGISLNLSLLDKH